MRVKGLHFKRFDDGELMQSLKDFIGSKKIQSGSVFCLGVLKNPVLGFFNWDTKNYKKIKVDKEVEIVSCYGNIARKKENDELLIHLHSVFSDDKGRTYGGHFFEGQVKLVEAMVFETEKVTKSLNQDTKLYCLDV